MKLYHCYRLTGSLLPYWYRMLCADIAEYRNEYRFTTTVCSFPVWCL